MTIVCNLAYIQTETKFHLHLASHYCVFQCQQPNIDVLADYFLANNVRVYTDLH